MYPRRVAALLAGPVLLLAAQPVLPFFVAGAVVAALGEALRVWATGHLRKNQDVITTGPYAHVRNPLYVGTFLVITGLIIAAASLEPRGLVLLGVALPLFWIVFFGYYLPYKCRVETARLERRFDDRAKHYNASVPSFVPRWRPYPGPKARWNVSLVFENSELGTFFAVVAGVAVLAVKLFVEFP